MLDIKTHFKHIERYIGSRSRIIPPPPEKSIIGKTNYANIMIIITPNLNAYFLIKITFHLKNAL